MMCSKEKVLLNMPNNSCRVKTTKAASYPPDLTQRIIILDFCSKFVSKLVADIWC